MGYRNSKHDNFPHNIILAMETPDISENGEKMYKAKLLYISEAGHANPTRSFSDNDSRFMKDFSRLFSRIADLPEDKSIFIPEDFIEYAENGNSLFTGDIRTKGLSGTEMDNLALANLKKFFKVIEEDFIANETIYNEGRTSELHSSLSYGISSILSDYNSQYQIHSFFLCQELPKEASLLNDDESNIIAYKVMTLTESQLGRMAQIFAYLDIINEKNKTLEMYLGSNRSRLDVSDVKNIKGDNTFKYVYIDEIPLGDALYIPSAFSSFLPMAKRLIEAKVPYGKYLYL